MERILPELDKPLPGNQPGQAPTSYTMQRIDDLEAKFVRLFVQTSDRLTAIEERLTELEATA